MTDGSRVGPHRRGACAAVALAAAAGLAVSAHADNRTIDGFDNNTSTPLMGMAGTDLMRMTPNEYADGVWQMGGTTRPNPRVISNTVFAQSGPIVNNRGLSDFVWVWGQFVDHDIDLTPDSSGETANIPVPAGDAWFDPTGTGNVSIPFNRSLYDTTTGTGPGNPRQQVNVITTWLDGSTIYGSDTSRASWLREGVGGRIRTSSSSTGDMLPYNDGTQDNAGGNGTNMFVSGDIRANENVVLTSMHTLFTREHNRIADQYAAANPGLSDEQVYQHARKVVGAEIQAITYNEFLPALLGDGAIPTYNGYDGSVNASIATEFSTAAYRLGHSMLSSTIQRLDADGNVIPDGNLTLADAFFRPDRLVNEGGIDPIMRGIAQGQMQEIDAKVIDDVRNMLFGPLFGPPGSSGLDLVSINIQRGRDHGLGDYNAVRAAYGLDPVTSFSDITSDATLQSELSSLYGDVNDVDAWVGMLAEDHVAGSSVGELVYRILVDQFTRLRDGDAYFYLNDADMTSDPTLMAQLSDLHLSDVIMRNTDITGMRQNLFFIPAPGVLASMAGAGLLAARRRRRA